jgi:hypothetical protein
LFQLTGPGLEREFGPVRSIDAFPGNLPLQLTSFVGRHDELEQILAELASVRVLTLTGVGGVGKTRLALQIAAEALPRFADGAWLIELGPIGDPDAVVEVATATLGIQQHQGRTLAESLVEALRTKEMLLVIDNCEHLLDASAALVTDLVRSCPNVRVLATSREALECPGSSPEGSRRFPYRRKRRVLTRWRAARRCDCSSSEPGRCATGSCSMPRPSGRWRRSVDASTGSRSRSSSPRRG